MFQTTSSNSGRNSCTRPHSKTTVFGPSLKTRLHCNHLRSKCKCPNISNQKRSHKTKHTAAETTSKRRVLSSSRALPRGETNGRKTYHSTDESVSVCDATWRPNLNNYSEDKSKTNIENHKYRNGDDKVIKKKLRFEDQITEHEKRHSLDRISDSVEDTNKSQMQDKVQPLPPREVPYTHSRINTRRGSERKSNKISEDYCRLCEATEEGYSLDSYRKRKKDEVPTDSSKNTSRFSPNPDYISSKENHEICFLCHRNKHNCRNYDSYCRICNTHVYSYGSQENVADYRQSQNQRNSAARHVFGDDDQQSSLTSIPYRPRTKFVKNLKQKLETTYRKDDSVPKGDIETHEVSGGTESNSNPQRHRNGRHDMHPGKKCLHRYQQNDRLFLEPTVTDRKGQSICSECGAPQPSNPQKDPYVYHITLGGMKSPDERTHNGSRSEYLHRGEQNGAAYLRRSRKKSYDTSKHIYAKLNDSIDNIFRNKGTHSTFSRPSAQTKSLASLYSKRHPSRSMALIDHII